MEDKLLKIIYDYSFKGRILSPKDMKVILEYLVNYYNLNNYIDFILINEIKYDKGENILVHYFNKTKQFVIYSDTVKTITTHIFNNSMFNRFDAIYYTNIYVMHVILHEIDHVIQFKNSKNKSNLTEEIMYLTNNVSKIINSRLLSQDLTDEELIKKVKKIESIFSNMWEYAPHERLAEYNSYKKILEITDEIKHKIPSVYEYIKFYLNTLLLQGYVENDTSSPTEIYFEAVDLKDTLENNTSYKKKEHDFFERYKLGLFIKPEEYKEEKRKLELLKKNFQ